MPSALATPSRALLPPLPVRASLRLARPSDSWHKRAFSVVAAAGVPLAVLLAVGRLDLAVYTMAGSLCALYGHDLPYAARARTVAWVVAGMTAGSAAALATASATGSVPVLIAVGALLAAAQKTVCDAVRIGPPGAVILTFISSACLFSPQPPGRLPELAGLTAGAGALAWLVTLAPALVRRDGPERRATARALLGAADLVAARTRGGADTARASRTAAGTDAAAWHTLLTARPGDGGRHTPLLRLLLHGEAVAADPSAGPADAERLRHWARLLRRRGPVPVPPDPDGTAERLLRVEAELAGAAGEGRGAGALRAALAPGSPLLPVALRTALGCAMAGGAAAALGVGRPYWAIVTAAALYQANVTLTWSRALQRTLGNLLGVLVFAATVPLAHQGPVALACCCLAFAFVTEAVITRNYWAGSLFVTPMALLICEFGTRQEAGGLVADRVLDTLAGAAFGLLAAAVVTNRRAGARVGRLAGRADAAGAAVERLMAAPDTAPAALEAARRDLAAALAALRAAADTAGGEWGHRPAAAADAARAEAAGHRTLTAAVRHRVRQGRNGEHAAR
ncbi:FUSC family protein [Streptomyces sp. NPDC049881]|uniref:FUSC family protein n=1 Tax=Streptomyces sp. NPDC049881 TaxID=3155778 RepID=UPI0034398502